MTAPLTFHQPYPGGHILLMLGQLSDGWTAWGNEADKFWRAA